MKSKMPLASYEIAYFLDIVRVDLDLEASQPMVPCLLSHSNKSKESHFSLAGGLCSHFKSKSI